MRFGKAGILALVAGGVAVCAAIPVLKKSLQELSLERTEVDGEFTPSSQRLEHRKLVDRSSIQHVWDSKPLAYKAVKRAADFTLSLAALVVLSPVLAITALAIFIEDGRPVVYAAPREGMDGKPFNMYKFRSMSRDAEDKLQELLNQNEQYGAAFKIKDDPRITKVGKFIRKTSIDELPQLVNIIMGDMSIVGPRAIQKAREFTPYESQRLVVKPGLTCYWQVLGRSCIPWDDWVELDLDYIQDASVWTDVKLIVATFGSVFRAIGAH